MDINVTKYETKEKTLIKLGEKIGEGSNSFVYDVVDDNGSLYVAKCSKSSKNYVSFNLQYNSLKRCESLVNDRLIVPKVILYGQADSVGDIMVMEKLDNLYDISFIINNSLFYGEIIIKKIAESIAKLHNIGISGYDVEFYWKADTNQLVMLDVGPQYTFGYNYEDMICKHLEIELNNFMGKWNIISQIIPMQEAKKYFSRIDSFDISCLKKFMNDDSMNIHITNVAKIHALSTVSKLTLQKQQYYLNIFLKEYKRVRDALTISSAIYLKSFRQTIQNRNMYAEACLYYSNVETLCKESCAVQLER